MTFFEIFLPATAALLCLIGLVVAYWVITRCKQSEFMPTYYFIGFSIISVLFMSLSRISSALFGSPLFNYSLMLDLMIAWSALFLFGALWQSYETSICVVPSQLDD
ncbi:MAG: hypothetical protein ACI8Z7_000166 [Candidatus Nanohaloarchaea archaeon]|jgi:hypothetical protein